jgi:hypothetical protein
LGAKILGSAQNRLISDLRCIRIGTVKPSVRLLPGRCYQVLPAPAGGVDLLIRHPSLKA